jgi:hypothetical protein
MFRLPVVALAFALLSACNHEIEEGIGDLGEGGIDPSATTEASASSGESSDASDETPPPDVGEAEASTAPAETGDDDPIPSMCGNGMVDADEDCDQNDFGLQTCMTWGFLAGELACNDDCTANTSGCLSESVCGDGVISGEEDCESSTDQTCVSLDLGEGELGCGKDCTYDASGCSCRGAGETCYVDWLMPGGQSNCCAPGFKGVVQGACGAGSGTCS